MTETISFAVILYCISLLLLSVYYQITYGLFWLYNALNSFTQIDNTNVPMCFSPQCFLTRMIPTLTKSDSSLCSDIIRKTECSMLHASQWHGISPITILPVITDLGKGLVFIAIFICKTLADRLLALKN